MSKCWRIEALVNTCLNWVKACLALGVRKLNSFALRIGFVKSDLAYFPSFLPLLPTTSLLSIPVACKVPVSWKIVFNIEVSRAAILLKL